MQLPDPGTGEHPLAPFLEERIAQGGEIARLPFNQPRFWIATAALAGLGLIALWTTAGNGSLAAWAARALGLAFLFGAVRFAQTRNNALVLTADSLTDANGHRLARIEDIASVDRSMFGLRPSNGFSIRLKEPAPRAWHPGLWWRFGTRIGVGGLTPVGPGRAMADFIGAMIATRKQW